MTGKAEETTTGKGREGKKEEKQLTLGWSVEGTGAEALAEARRGEEEDGDAGESGEHDDEQVAARSLSSSPLIQGISLRRVTQKKTSGTVRCSPY